MDQNSTNFGGAGAGNSALGAGTDSLSVTGTGAGQSAAGGLTPAGGAQGDVGGAGQGLNDQAAGGQGIGERLSGARDAAADKLSQARDVAGERLGQARERATELKATLADKLEQGAQSLRQQQGGAQQFAGANGATADAAAGLGKYAAPAAVAMEKTAGFLRGEGDLKGAIEEQVRTAPGRTLLIAVGLGYLLGKAIRR
jgi:hypothetical protein